MTFLHVSLIYRDTNGVLNIWIQVLIVLYSVNKRRKKVYSSCRLSSSIILDTLLYDIPSCFINLPRHQWCFEYLDKGLNFTQLFHSFSTAFPQLFHSFSTAFPQLFHSFSAAFLQLHSHGRMISIIPYVPPQKDALFFFLLFTSFL